MRALAHVLRADGKRLVPLATSAASADVLGRDSTADQDAARAEKVTAVLIKRCRTVLTERCCYITQITNR